MILKEGQMAEKTLRLLSTLRDVAGMNQIVIPFERAQTVREMLDTIGKISPLVRDQVLGDEGELTGMVHILVDGRNIIWLQGLDTMIPEDAEVILLPPSAGG